MNTYFESIILGITQGIAEWLPISSEGMIVLLQNNIFKTSGLMDSIELALFLHLGTFLAALVYLRKDVWKLLKVLFKYKESESKHRCLFWYLLFSTLVSGAIGGSLLYYFSHLEKTIELGASYINATIGFLLIGTGIMIYKAKTEGLRGINDLFWKDWLVVGVMQGLAILPGFSRSGLSVSGLLLRHFKEDTALRVSFLMSLPVVLGANIVLNFNKPIFTWNHLIALVFAFVFGLLTIDLLIKIARKIEFGYFVMAFGVLMIIFSVI